MSPTRAGGAEFALGQGSTCSRRRSLLPLDPIGTPGAEQDYVFSQTATHT